MKIPFTKMHGTGNDFIVIDEFQKILVPERDKPKFVARISQRHFGIGSDGVIFIQKSDKYDAKFSFYNPDGTRAEMCGNGMRCFAKYLYKKGLIRKEKIQVETTAGLVVPEILLEEGRVTKVRVDMGMPRVEFIAKEVEIDGYPYKITSVNMGNPHAILFFDNIDEVDVLGMGKKVRHHKLFPRGTNVHFVQKIGENEFKIRTYERGVEGETLACGTGICASAVATVVNNYANEKKPLTFHAKGGDLIIELEIVNKNINKNIKIERVFMTGPAEEVFTGEISVEL